MLKKLIVGLGVTVPVLLAGNVLAATLPNLTPGSQFRYVFVTSGTRNATSNDINDYNTFVDNAASNGSSTSTIPGAWTVIGSTATVTARTNTATTGTGGVPIYRLDGALVANNYGDLWDGSIANILNVNENDATVPTRVTVWTGTGTDGSIVTNIDSNPLGTAMVGQGNPNNPNSAWINNNFFVADSALTRRLYAMSSIQQIPPDPVIPEPTTIIASLLVGAGLLPLKRRRHKN